MKKYRLIKKYPGSPKLGIILTPKSSRSEFMYDENNINVFRHKNEIENQPEFWEEVIEKDYEILSFYAKNISGKGDDFVDPDYIWYETSKGNGKWSRKGHITSPYNIQEITNHSGYGIHSVKRLSDGEIFTVGDKLKGYKNTGIKKICLYSYGLRIITDANGDGCVTDKLSWTLENCIKLKQPLFTTVDGIDIYEGDDVHGVWDGFTYFYSKNVDKTHCNLINSGKKGLVKIFPTEKAAKEYILMNKPCLSISDLLYNGVTFNSKLIELVKSKL